MTEALREFPGLALLVRVPGWHRLAACRGVGPEVFFPIRRRGQANHGAEAKAICAQCPVQAQCLDAAMSPYDEHGIWGGAGEADRRVFRRARPDRPHESPEVQAGCGCAWCSNLSLLLARLDGDRSAVADSNGAAFQHGRRSSYNRGCRCDACRWSASVLGQVLAQGGVDTASWWTERAVPGDYQTAKAPVDSAAWAWIESVVVGLMALSPAAPGDLAVRRAVADRRAWWVATRARAEAPVDVAEAA